MRNTTILALLLVCFPGALAAAEFEITPLIGYRWGDTADGDSCDVCVWEEFDEDLYQTEARVGLVVRF